MNMKTISRLMGVGVVLGSAALAFGQQGDFPAQIRDVRLYRITTDGRVRIDPDTYRAKELENLVMEVDVFDPDIASVQRLEDYELFYRFSAQWVPFLPYFTPEPPPWPEGPTDGFVEPWFRLATVPPSPPGTDTQTTVTFSVFLRVPEFNGVNQARLRGLIDYDVRFNCLIEVSEQEEPSEEQPPDRRSFFVYAVEDPALRPPNPPPFADAGADATVVVGSTVDLDGKETFDSFNLGYNPLDPNVIEKDLLTYTWEWVTGPQRVDPYYPDLAGRPWLARVTLPLLGIYEYRLLVSDGYNAIPSLDTFKINVVSYLPPNRPPRAVILGPTRAITVGEIILLDGRQSSDPDGDRLTFRWRQVNEVGGNLPPDDLALLFQPLGGASSSTLTWQAVRPGTYYFLLIVSDGRDRGTARMTVRVIEAQQAADASKPRSSSAPQTEEPPAGETPATPAAPAGCGGGLAPLALVPLGLGLMYRRNR